MISSLRRSQTLNTCISACEVRKEGRSRAHTEVDNYRVPVMFWWCAAWVIYEQIDRANDRIDRHIEHAAARDMNARSDESKSRAEQQGGTLDEHCLQLCIMCRCNKGRISIVSFRRENLSDLRNQDIKNYIPRCTSNPFRSDK
jgi:hypothetical protein